MFSRFRRGAVWIGVVALGLVAVPALAWAMSTPARRSAARHHQTVRHIEVADDMYTPMRITIRQGDAVDFVWSDDNFNTHNVTLVAAPHGVDLRHFRSIDAARGLHFERTFTIPGRYSFMCTIHPDMTATVIVRPGHAG